MIAYITGKVIQKSQAFAIVQTESGVGYQLYLNHMDSISNDEVAYFVHTYMREDELKLYGFHSFEEKQVFEQLLKASGVGPKLAMTMLATYSPETLCQIVNNQDELQLQSIPGVGQKKAKKICLELTELLKNFDYTSASISTKTHQGELVSALANLGFSEKNIIAAMSTLHLENLTFEEQMKLVLATLKPPY